MLQLHYILININIKYMPRSRSKSKLKTKTKKDNIINEFKKLYGCSTKCSDDLYRLGMRSLDDIKKSDPNQLFDKLSELKGKQDRCVLYVLKCIHYQVTVPKSEQNIKLLLWWNWKDNISPKCFNKTKIKAKTIKKTK